MSAMKIDPEMLKMLRRRLISAGGGDVQLPADFVVALVDDLDEKTKTLEAYTHRVDAVLKSCGDEEWAGVL